MISIRRYDWVLHLATLGVCSYLLATTAVTYLSGVLEAGAEVAQESPSSNPSASSVMSVGSMEDYQVILDRNFFNSTSSATPEKEGDDVAQVPTGELGPAVKTNLDIKLMGTLSIEEGKDRRSSAIIVGGKESKGATTYFVGDEKSFGPNIKITQVLKNHVEFINNGRLEFIEKDDSTKQSIFSSIDDVFGKNAPVASKGADDASADVGGKVVIEQKDVDDALQNLDRLYNDVRIVPNFKDGRPAGMKVLSVKPGSLVSKLGVKRGDVLEKVNGQELDMKRGMDLFNQMRDMKNFSVEIERGGRNQTLEYEIR